MCGIAGIASFDGDISRPAAIRRMTDAMRRRGPDDEGFVFVGTAEATCLGGADTPADAFGRPWRYSPRVRFDGSPPGGASLAFGHRRLSIIDLSPAGHQPMATEDGRFWIVFNGEIYNFRELRRALEAEGHTFRSNSDTEALLLGFATWGEAVLERITGMFAFAIWDRQRQSLFCARDRLGIKPFYFIRGDGMFAFASEIPALLASGLVAPRPNLEGVWHNLSLQAVPRPMTCFEGIEALEQAHCLEVTAAGVSAPRRYWQVPVGPVDAAMRSDQAIALVESTLGRCIERQLVSDVPVGTMMSGGIDSTTLSAMAGRIHPSIAAFTVAVSGEDKRYDEVREARDTARMNNLSHLIENVRAEDVLADVEDMAACIDEPHVTISPTYVISRAIGRNGLKVVFNGLGGDELFAGYTRYLALPAWHRAGPLRPLAKLLPPVGPLKPLRKLMASPDIPAFFTAWQKGLTHAEKRAVFGRELGEESSRFLARQCRFDEQRFADPVQALSYLDLMHYVGNYQLPRGDLFAMRFSIETRFPYLDEELIAAAMRIPTCHKLKGGKGKHVLREVARSYIAPSCLEARKTGFSLPSAAWFRNELKAFRDEKLDRLKRRGLLSDSPAAQAVITRFPARFVLLELWLESFFDAAPTRSEAS